MAVRFKISKGRKKTFLKLPLSFLEHFLPIVNGDYLKIYLYGLEACLEKRSLQDSEIASALGVLPADVGNAWRFWEEKGVVFQTADGSVARSRRRKMYSEKHWFFRERQHRNMQTGAY